MRYCGNYILDIDVDYICRIMSFEEGCERLRGRDEIEVGARSPPVNFLFENCHVIDAEALSTNASLGYDQSLH